MTTIRHKRILVKLSGEALQGSQNSGIDQAMIDKLANELIELRSVSPTEASEAACRPCPGESTLVLNP